MGFLGKLFGKKKAESGVVAEKNTPISQSLPTIKTPPEHRKAFQQIFYDVVPTLTPMHPDDVDIMFGMIANCEGGFPNQGGWVNAVFDRFFAGAEYTWPELDMWNDLFSTHGYKRFFSYIRTESFSIERMCKELKVAEIKEVLNSLGVRPSSKATKSDLIFLTEQSATPQIFAAACPAWKVAADKLVTGNRRAFFLLLVQMLNARANNLSTRMRLEDAGIKVILEYPNEWEKPFIEEIRQRNPKTTPPFFPFSRAYYAPKID